MQFTSFLPAISKDALKKISAEVRSWRLHRCTGMTSADIAKMINPKVRGWLTYYGAFYHTALYPVLHRINTYLMRWIMNKYKKLRTWKKATQALAEAAGTRPRYFAHWAWAKPNAMGFRHLGVRARFPVMVTVGSSWSRACRRPACRAG